MKHTRQAKEEMEAKGVKFDTPRLELAKKDEKGVPQSNGVHRVTALRDERRDDITIFVGANTKKEVAGIRYWFDEAGVEKYYDVPLMTKEGNPHYLISRFDEINEGDALEIEYIKKGEKGFIDVRKVGGTEELPSIDFDESDEGHPFGA